jgi:hypothetical protein
MQTYLEVPDYIRATDYAVARANGHTPDRLARDRLFLSQSARARLEFAITGIEPCAVSGERDHNQARIALGEIGDIWPASIFSS